MAHVKRFGAAGDGRQDDTDAILHALAEGDGVLEFAPGVYRISRTLEIDLAQHGPLSVHGSGGAARLVMSAAGPALRLVGHHAGTAVPADLTPQTRDVERLPQVSALEITGDHPEADGLELVGTMQATISGVLLRGLRHGIVLAERNRNFLLSHTHVYDNSGIGVWFRRCNLHQAIVSACHISYNRVCGIRSEDCDLHNLQITGNDIEYNYDAAGQGAADIWLDAQSGKASEVTIASNTIQAVPSPGGTNVRITGLAESPPRSAPLIAISGNVIGSQETNVELRHADRVLVSGNALYDGRAATILAEDSHHLVVSGNTFGWSQPGEREVTGGVHLVRCNGANLSGLVLADERAGDETAGGAIWLQQCADSSVHNCQVLDPRWRGIALADCRRVRVSDNSVLDRRTPPEMLAAIEITGGGQNLVQNNLATAGRIAGIRCPIESGMTQGNVVLE